jgi:hypothetical protein
VAEYVSIADGVEGYAFYDPETNELVTLDSDRPGSAQTNLRPASKEEIDGARRGFAAESASQKARGLAEQAVGGATFGLLTDESPEARARAAVLGQENPILKGVARVAGTLAPTLATGGLAGGAGAAVGLGRVATGILTAGAEELTQAAAYEMAAAAEEDRKIEVGNIAQGLLEGAAFLGAGRFASKAFRRTEEAVADVAGSPAQTIARAQKQAATAQDVATKTPSRSEAIHYRDNAEQIHQEASDLAYESGNKLFGRNGSAQRAHNIGFKKQDVWGKMTDADVDAVADGAEAFADQLDELATKLSDGTRTSAPSAAAARSIRKQAENLRASTVLDVEDAAVAFDGAKRHLDDLRSKFGGHATKSTDPLRTNVGLIDEVLEPMRKDLEDSAKWGQVWAKKQAEENRLWSGDDGIINSRARWQSKLMEREPGAAGSYRTEWGDMPAFRMHGDDLVKRVMGLGRKDREVVLNALESDINKSLEMSRIKQDIGGPQTRTAVGEAMADLEAFKESIDEIRRIDRVNKKWGALISRGASKGAVEEVLDAAPLAGAIGGGIPGAVAGVAARGLKKTLLDAVTPGAKESAALTLDEMRKNIAARNASRLSGKFSTSGSMGARLGDISRAAAGAVGPAAKETAVEVGGGALAGLSVLGFAAETAAIRELDQHSRETTERAMLDLGSPDGDSLNLPPVSKRFQGEAASLQEAYAAKMADLNRLIDDPEEFIARTTAAFQPLADAGHPELASKLITRMAVGLRYLRENAPPTLNASMWNPEGSLPDEIAVLQFAPVWEAVWRPLDTVRDLSTRSATPSAIKALQAVHPDVYQRAMVEVFRTLAMSGPNTDFETKRYLDNVFGLGAAVGRSFSPAMSNLLANQRQDNKPTSRSLGGETNVAPESATVGFSKGPTAIR